MDDAFTRRSLILPAVIEHNSVACSPIWPVFASTFGADPHPRRRRDHECLRRGWRRWDQRSLVLLVRLRRSISRSSHGSRSSRCSRSSRSSRSSASSSVALFHAHRRSVDGPVGVGFRDRVRHGCRTTSLHGCTCGGSRKPTPAGPLPGNSPTALLLKLSSAQAFRPPCSQDGEPSPLNSHLRRQRIHMPARIARAQRQ